MESHQEVYQNGHCAAEFTPENVKNADHFIIEDLLDLPNDESMAAADGGFETVMTDSSTVTVTAVDTSCNSSFSAGSLADPHFHPAEFGGPGGSTAGGNFSGELCVPYDVMAELEWLSNFVEESFSSKDLQKLQLIQGVDTRPDESSETHSYQFQPGMIRPGAVLRPEMSIPAKARSKRSRAAPGNWTSRLLVVSPTPPATVPALSSSPESDISTTGKKSPKPVVQKKKEGSDNSSGGDGRKCLHCATDKTPQWRTGPMGPKTLCNACGVRYKSGRLVPEYRPAASPTFVLTKHSNSHRKVLELRRQKELQRAQHQQQEQQQQQQQQLFLHRHYHHHHQNMMFDVANGEDYLIHQHIGPDFRQMI